MRRAIKRFDDPFSRVHMAARVMLSQGDAILVRAISFLFFFFREAGVNIVETKFEPFLYIYVGGYGSVFRIAPMKKKKTYIHTDISSLLIVCRSFALCIFGRGGLFVANINYLYLYFTLKFSM